MKGETDSAMPKRTVPTAARCQAMAAEVICGHPHISQDSLLGTVNPPALPTTLTPQRKAPISVSRLLIMGTFPVLL